MGSASKILQYRYRFSQGLRPSSRCYTYKCNQTKHKLETATKKSFKSAYNITYSGSFIHFREKKFNYNRTMEVRYNRNFAENKTRLCCLCLFSLKEQVAIYHQNTRVLEFDISLRLT